MSNIVITGANRGIGLALADWFNQRGDSVVGVCRETSSELDALGVRVEQGIDITSRESLEQLAQRLSDVQIDVLINNAGVMRRSDFQNIEDQLDDYRLQFEVNSLSPLRVTRALLGKLGKGSKVAIITSRMGSIADNTTGGHYGYRMSKAAVNMAGVGLAHELKDRGIAVGLLHPGYVQTDMTGQTGNVTPAESAAGLGQRIGELSMATTGSFRHA
ncbi:MAG: SDR family oxidoreductase, partial [Wenzhouxiangellaceae bacterium]|nr:SDR family oxidoreductase [Wenzhouxiangellaceae bacterium]